MGRNKIYKYVWAFIGIDIYRYIWLCMTLDMFCIGTYGNVRVYMGIYVYVLTCICIYIYVFMYGCI